MMIGNTLQINSRTLRATRVFFFLEKEGNRLCQDNHSKSIESSGVARVKRDKMNILKNFVSIHYSYSSSSSFFMCGNIFSSTIESLPG